MEDPEYDDDNGQTHGVVPILDTWASATGNGRCTADKDLKAQDLQDEVGEEAMCT